MDLIRLIELEGLEQEEAAEKLGVSWKTAQQDHHEARRENRRCARQWQRHQYGGLHKGC
jgi:predicted DNA-binding protein (UPF0251 family)